MTETQRAAMQQALERLRKYHHGNGFAEDAECIADLEAALAQQAEPEPKPKPIALPSEDKARQAFWDCYPDSGNADMRDVWMTCYRWCRAIVAVPQQQAEPEPEPVAERNREWHDGFLEGRLRERQYWLAGCCMNTTPPTRRSEPEPVAWATEIIDALQAQYDTEMIQENDSGDALIRLDQAIAAVEDVEKYYTTPPARRPLTLEEIMDAVRDADLDWHTGWSLGDDAPNRYITLIRAIERKITGGNDE